MPPPSEWGTGQPYGGCQTRTRLPAPHARWCYPLLCGPSRGVHGAEISIQISALAASQGWNLGPLTWQSSMLPQPTAHPLTSLPRIFILCFVFSCRRIAIIVGCVLGGLAIVIFFIIVIIVVAQKRAKTRKHNILLTDKIKYGDKQLEVCIYFYLYNNYYLQVVWSLYIFLLI